MKEKRGFKEYLKNNIINVILLFIVISVIGVFAGDVIFQEGDMEIENIDLTNLTYVSENSTCESYLQESSEVKYLELDGAGDYVVVSSTSGLPSGNVAKSVGGWFKSTTSDTNNHMLFGFGTASSGQLFQIGVDLYNDQWRVNAWGGGLDWETGLTASTYFNGNWHHVVATYNGTTTRLYLDGSEVNSTSSKTFNTGTNSIVIGEEIDLAGWAFDGSIDEVMIFNDTLNLTEIQSLNNSGRNLGSYSDNNLVSHWRFDDGTADDDKGINDGNLTGDATIIEQGINKVRFGCGLLADSYSDYTPASDINTSQGIRDYFGNIQDTPDGKIDHSSLGRCGEGNKRDLGCMITYIVEFIKDTLNWNEEQDEKIELLETELCQKDDSYEFCS